jgi:hypothetical protein
MTGQDFQTDDAFVEWQQNRARRVKKNEAAFRAHNERREELEREGGVHDDETVPFICECADIECHTPIALSVSEFESAHSQPDRYTVSPGHLLPEFEEVTDQHDRYWVLRKFRPDEIEKHVVTDTATA